MDSTIEVANFSTKSRLSGTLWAQNLHGFLVRVPSLLQSLI